MASKRSYRIEELYILSGREAELNAKAKAESEATGIPSLTSATDRLAIRKADTKKQYSKIVEKRKANVVESAEHRENLMRKLGSDSTGNESGG